MPNRPRCTLYLTPMHAAIDKRMTLIANIRAALSHISSVAEQLPQANRLRTFVNYGVAKITRPFPPWQLPDLLALGGNCRIWDQTTLTRI